MQRTRTMQWRRRQTLHGPAIYTASQKNCARLHCFTTLTNVGCFSKFFHCCILHKICNKTHATVPTTLNVTGFVVYSVAQFLDSLCILHRPRTRGRTVWAAFDKQCPSNHLQNWPRYRPVDDRQRTVRDRLIEGCRLQTARTGFKGCPVVELVGQEVMYWAGCGNYSREWLFCDAVCCWLHELTYRSTCLWNTSFVRHWITQFVCKNTRLKIQKYTPKIEKNIHTVSFLICKHYTIAVSINPLSL